MITGITNIPQMERCHSLSHSLKQRGEIGFTKLREPSWVDVHTKLLPRDGKKQTMRAPLCTARTPAQDFVALIGSYPRAKKHIGKQSAPSSR